MTASKDAYERFWWRVDRHLGGLSKLEVEGLRDVPRTDQTEPVRLNYGFGLRPLTVEAALEWAERLADEQL